MKACIIITFSLSKEMPKHTLGFCLSDQLSFPELIQLEIVLAVPLQARCPSHHPSHSKKSIKGTKNNKIKNELLQIACLS